MKAIFLLSLLSVASLNAHANGICGSDKQVFQCLISAGSLQQVDLCKGTSGKIYMSELDDAGATKRVNLSDAQLNRWNTQHILQWNCGKVEQQLGTCFTIKGNEYTLNEMGTSSIGYCD